jgi:hypothetical protein
MDQNRRDVLPSSRSDLEAQAKQEAMKRAEMRASSMREDFTRTFKTASGKRVMAWLKKRCGFGQIILSADRQSGQIDPTLTTFAAMELNLYLEIRKHLPIELIQEIEDERRIEPSGHISHPTTEQPTERITSRRRRSPD